MLKTLIPFAALLATAAPALAQPDPISRVSLHVGYHDLNLASAAGAAELDRRINRAVNTLCPEPDSRSLAQMVAYKQCRQTALASVAPQREQAFAKARSGSITVASGR